MACCIVAALLISLYHRLAPRRARRADLDVGFAPAASSARVRFEELAQGFGDDLYKSRFDAPQATANH